MSGSVTARTDDYDDADYGDVVDGGGDDTRVARISTRASSRRTRSHNVLLRFSCCSRVHTTDSHFFGAHVPIHHAVVDHSRGTAASSPVSRRGPPVRGASAIAQGSATRKDAKRRDGRLSHLLTSECYEERRHHCHHGWLIDAARVDNAVGQRDPSIGRTCLLLSTRCQQSRSQRGREERPRSISERTRDRSRDKCEWSVDRCVRARLNAISLSLIRRHNVTTNPAERSPECVTVVITAPTFKRVNGGAAAGRIAQTKLDDGFPRGATTPPARRPIRDWPLVESPVAPRGSSAALGWVRARFGDEGAGAANLCLDASGAPCKVEKLISL